MARRAGRKTDVRILLPVKAIRFFESKRSPALSVAAIAICLLAGCASSKQETWAEDKSGVLKKLELQHELSSDNNSGIMTLQQQVMLIQSQLLAQERKLNAMEAGQRALDSSLQEAVSNLQALKSKVLGPSENGMLVDKELAEKIEKIEASIEQAKAASSSVAAASKNSEEENAYTAAYLELKSGRYDEAIASFLTFLKAYPDGGFSDQAYFWLGEGYLAKNMHKEAVNSFNTLINTFTESPKLPAAQLKLGMAYEQNGQIKMAIESYKALLRDHADSDSATVAGRRLSAITSRAKE